MSIGVSADGRPVVRLLCGATGIPVSTDLALYVSAQDNDLGLDLIDFDGSPRLTGPLPTPREVGAVRMALRVTASYHQCPPKVLTYKFDGGRGALLCPDCHKIVGYLPPDNPFRRES